ncbi:cache domain-containing sensor histidine kinase [Paenibacillus sp. Z6-24]
MNRLQSGIRELFRRLNGISLQSRLIIAYIVVILLPTAGISYYSYQQINTTYIQDTRLKSINTLQNEKQTIQTQIETMERAAQLAVSDKSVIQYLTEDEDTPTAELLEFNTSSYARLAQIQINNPSILHLRLYSNSTNTYEIWPIILHEERTADAPWYGLARGLGDREAWYMQRSDLSQSGTDNSRALEPDPPKLSLLRELELPKGHHAGMIQVDMRLSDLAPLTFGQSQEDSSRMLLLDAGGGNVSSYTEQNLHTRLADRLLSSAGDSERLAAGELSAQYRADGQSYLLTSIPVERLGARLVHVTSLEKMLQDTGRARNLIILATVGFIVLVSLITYVANSLILKNLRKLTQAMKQMRRGEFPSVVQVAGGGEIGELVYHFNRMNGTINELIAQAVRKQALMKEAELRTLYSQIDAHFLYNTLENIKMLAEIEDQRQISDALTSLGGMMRYNFKWTGEYVKLEEELRHIRNYIDVMNIRYEEPVELEMDIAPLDLELTLLKMSLQPLVENAFKHAWEESAPVCHLLICSAEREDGVMTITVQDNGRGIPEPELEQLRARIREAGIRQEELHDEPAGYAPGTTGIGLQNVERRIRLFYGEQYGIQIHSKVGLGTQVELIIPKRIQAGGGS